MLILIAVAVVVLIILLAVAFAVAFSSLDRAAKEVEAEREETDRAYNPNLTMGYEVSMRAEKEKMIEEARTLAAKQAAALPRGANMRIGRLGESNTMKTAYDGAKEQRDPFTAAKIAAYHGWDGLRSGFVSAQEQQAAPQAAQPKAKKGKIKLEPGKDYPHTEITDDMPPEEKRKARIANAKARSKAMKEAKAAQAAGQPVPTEAPAQQAPAQQQAQPSPAAAAGIPEPDYKEITDDMGADEVRKARIHNAKARSKYHKALKEAGIDPKEAQQQQQAAQQQQEQQAQPAPQTQAASDPAAAAGVPEPDYIEITDDMEADEVRKARVHNAKARSKYHKALKEAGLDPKEVQKQKEQAQQQASQEAPQADAEPAAADGNGGGPDPAAAAGIPEPDYIEITDDMDADEVRQARVHNAKARSKYFKELKAAGIDPKSVAKK